jgi:aspartate aminotransferase
MYLSNKLDHIAPSGTVAFTTLIRELRAAGKDVIDLAVGEPEFAVDAPIVDATCHALENGVTRYGPVAGLPELRERLARDFEGCGPQHVIITNGAKQGLYEIFQVVCGEGREVIVPAPCWVSFEHQIRLAGGVPILVETRQHQLDVDAIEQVVTQRTAAILINSPNNPTGAVYDRRDIARVADLCHQKNLWLISDEAYSAFVYRPEVFVSPFSIPEIRSQLIVVRSFSKTYAMTGFRVGYVVAPEEVITRLTTFQGHLTGNVCSFAQYGAMQALDISETTLEDRRAGYEERCRLAVRLCKEIFDLIEPQGAFYLFPQLDRYQERFADDRDFARYLLEKANVAVVPGTFFGVPGHIRISFATSDDRLREGFARMKDAL